MSNILKVTTPMVGYDNSNSVKVGPENQPQNRNIQGEVRPDQVVRPDARSDAASQQAEADIKFKFESNFDNFVQQLTRSANLTKEFSSVFLEKLGMIAESGLKSGFAGEVAEFMNLISLNPSELAAFLKMQGQSAVRFNGAFFAVLRQMLQNSSSVEMRTGILDFLKRYVDMAEGQHTLNNIQQLLDKIKGGMLRDASQQLSQLEQGMNYKGGSIRDNAATLKNQLLPFINNYITQMHERGSLRENTAMLGALTARYENGDGSRLMESFMKLMEFTPFAEKFKNLDPAMLLKILQNSEFEKASMRNNAMEHFAEVIRRGVMGEAGLDNKAAFRELMNAMLLNESVYMPVLHLMLPVNVGGTLMFSEMWIDPDDDGSSTGKDASEKYVKGLIKFDIQDVGFFDLFFIYGKETEKVSIRLNYPKDLPATDTQIEGVLSQILTRNGLEADELIVESSDVSIPISAAFPNIFERKNSINVRV